MMKSPICQRRERPEMKAKFDIARSSILQSNETESLPDRAIPSTSRSPDVVSQDDSGAEEACAAVDNCEDLSQDDLKGEEDVLIEDPEDVIMSDLNETLIKAEDKQLSEAGCTAVVEKTPVNLQEMEGIQRLVCRPRTPEKVTEKETRSKSNRHEATGEKCKRKLFKKYKHQGNSIRVSKSARSGLVFPVGRVTSKLRKGRYSKRFGACAGVYMASVLQYLTTEVLDLAGALARARNVRRVSPRVIYLSIKYDEELDKLFGDVIIPEGGVMPYVHPALMGKKNLEDITDQEAVF